MPLPSQRRRILALCAAGCALATAALLAKDRPAESPLTLESIKITPAAPAADTLCHLSVTVRNAGTLPIGALQLEVAIDGHTLPAYRDRLLLIPIEPGAARELRLYNFWSTEPSRPAPSSGKLTVDVKLTAASWMRRESKDGATVWTPAGSVPGLPAKKTIALTLAAASPADGPSGHE